METKRILKSALLALLTILLTPFFYRIVEFSWVIAGFDTGPLTGADFMGFMGSSLFFFSGIGFALFYMVKDA